MNKSDLHGYQIDAINHIINNKYCALFLEMGLGKTISTLTAINNLMYEELEIMRVLVIAPKQVAEIVWSSQIKEWEHVRHLKISKITGDAKQRKTALQKKADIYIISRDNIAWLCGLYGGSRLPFDMLVIDELSSFKNNNSVRFKALKKVKNSFKRVVGLTGTPAPNGLIDLWSQIYLLDEGQRLGRFITDYRYNYFTLRGRRYKLRKGADEKIHDKIKDICISMKSEDHLKLPGVVYNNIEIKLPMDIQKKYDDFEREKILSLIAELKEGDTEITAMNAAALSTKLLQFASGAIYDEDRNYHIVHDLKLEATKEIIENANGKPVLIARSYKHSLDRLMEALKKYNPRSFKDEKDVDDWNAGKVQVMIIHPASGGHGLNLQYGGHIILWYDQIWSLEWKQQLDARVARQGQVEKVIINKLVACKTIDQDVIRAQKFKTDTQDALMKAVKSRINKYLKT
jgi:SNF2 family DNA or RNA helicase